MVTWSTWIPRSVSSSSTSRYDSAKRRYQRTASTMTSGGKQKPAKADEAIGAGPGRRVVMATVCVPWLAHSRCNSATYPHADPKDGEESGPEGSSGAPKKSTPGG